MHVLYMFCTTDCYQVHPFTVDITIKSDTSVLNQNNCTSNI